MTFYFLILFSLYFVLLVVLRIGWAKAVAQRKIKFANKNFFISVIIPIRNEERNVDKLLMGLSNQNYPSVNFEVIIVDDHSTDDSIRQVEENRWYFQNLTVLALDETVTGKKSALTRGIEFAKGEIIVTTDADCSLPSSWLSTINSCFQDNSINMTAGMVRMEDQYKFFSRWQAMEFASVIGTGVAAFGLNMPMMCNGANLSFRKKVFQEVSGYEGNLHVPSGDDEFLMRKTLGRYPGSVRLLSSPETIVVTQPQTSVKDFLYQRIRWASKWRGNPSITAKLLAVFIFLIQTSWFFFLITVFTYDYKIAIVILMQKIGADSLFLLPVFRFLKIKFRLLPFLGLQFLYPFYVILVGLFAPWISYPWKDRKIL